MGARVEVYAVDVKVDAEPVVNLTCIAPDEAKAADLVMQMASNSVPYFGSSEPQIALPNGERAYGVISHTESKILCKDIPTYKLSGLHPAEFLAKLATYLESQGCRHFEFSIAGKRDD